MDTCNSSHFLYSTCHFFHTLPFLSNPALHLPQAQCLSPTCNSLCTLLSSSSPLLVFVVLFWPSSYLSLHLLFTSCLGSQLLSSQAIIFSLLVSFHCFHSPLLLLVSNLVHKLLIVLWSTNVTLTLFRPFTESHWLKVWFKKPHEIFQGLLNLSLQLRLEYRLFTNLDKVWISCNGSRKVTICLS